MAAGLCERLNGAHCAITTQNALLNSVSFQNIVTEPLYSIVCVYVVSLTNLVRAAAQMCQSNLNVTRIYSAFVKIF